MMRFIIFLSMISAFCFSKPIITKEFLEEVKQKASWTVTDYDENVFKGLEDEDLTEDTRHSLPPKKLRVPEINSGLDCNLNAHNMGEFCQGSSFAFAVAGMVSMRCCIKKNKNEGWLSPMELISCDSGNYGCAGGWPRTALKYVEQNGLVPEACYPYNGQNEACPTNCKNGTSFKDAHRCKVTNIQTIKTADDAKKALQNGPIVLSFEAYADLWAYKGGIYCHTTGGFKRVISVTVVSYETTPKPHFKILMPFGPKFGEEGYLRMCMTCCGMFIKYEKGNVVCDIA